MDNMEQILDLLNKNCEDTETFLTISDYIEEINEGSSNLKQQLEVKENENRRLNLDAQKWFDMCMDLLHGVTKPEDYK